jgi:hypothetical protein
LTAKVLLFFDTCKYFDTFLTKKMHFATYATQNVDNYLIFKGVRV